MKFIKKILSNSENLFLLLVLISGVVASRDLLFSNGYFNMHDDLQMMRQLEIEKCFMDLQIPCRWVPDMGYGFGFPLFNYYPPLPYLIGQVIRLTGVSFVTTIKMLFAISIIASGVGMYYLAKDFFGKLSGLVSAVFYIWAPYHAVDIYVRGAMNEAWALIWFPLILLFSKNIFEKAKNEKSLILLLALSWFGLLTSHNLMVLIFTPVFAVWCLIFLLKHKSYSRIYSLVLSGLFGIGLSSFFTLPAIFEQKYVQVSTLVTGYYEYIAHFASIDQLLFTRFWGFGPSIWGDGDGMSFQIGHIHWIISIVVLLLILYTKFVKKNKSIIGSLPILFMIGVSWLALFMIHARSIYIWQIFEPLKFVQFPWRFLTLATFGLSFASGATLLYFSKKIQSVIALVLLFLVVIINWNYFKPERIGPLTDKEKFSGAAWDLQQTAGIYDYLPKEAFTAPKKAKTALVEVMSGDAKIENSREGTNWANFKVEVNSDTAKLRIGIFKFPNWTAYVDRKETEIYIEKGEEWGRIYIDVSRGVHNVELKLNNTPIRTFANIVSFTSWIILGFMLIKIFKNARA